MVVSVPDRHLGGYVIGGLVGVVIGLVLMKGEWIVRFVYGPELTKENSN
jgi:ABC-type nitrate/sulfonate/bicarbonate transport system permease component